ncbi:MAG: homocysteine S-methyltransferase family protein [Pseudomonadota bacterium]
MNNTNHHVTLLDGGMGMELTRRSAAAEAVPLWSAQVMMDEPQLVEDVHREFIEAGAEIVTLNTYAATPRRLLRNGYGDITETLHTEAVRIARAARAAAGRDVRIAGCLSPVVQSYRAEKVPAYGEALAEFRHLSALQAPHVDLIIAETMTSIGEGLAATVAARETGLSCWTAFTVDDADGTLLRSGEPVIAAFAAARAAGASALLLNCSRPEAITAGLAAVVAEMPDLGLPLGAYANGFVSIAALDSDRSVDVLETRTDLSPADYAAHAMRWVTLGATIVGGCCEVGPAHIAAIAAELKLAA